MNSGAPGEHPSAPSALTLPDSLAANEVAATVSITANADPHTDPMDRTWRNVRWGLMVSYVVVTYVLLQRAGQVPYDREIVVGWIIGLAFLATIGRPIRSAVTVLLSWAPFLLCLFLYDFARAVGHWLDRPLAVTPQITIDRVLGGGRLWTERLQDWLIDDRVGLRTRPIREVEQIMRRDESTLHWYDVVASAVYQSHFFLPYLAAGFLWARGQRVWRWYAATFVAVNFASCAIFAAYATAPPWYAANKGLIEPFPRIIAGRGWSKIGLRFASRIIEKGQETVNPFAAIPSLHSAQALLVAIFAWKLVWPWLRPLLAAYPLLMTFSLVYSGEHYLIDVFAGWGMVALALTAGWWMRQRFRWRSPWVDGPGLSDHRAKPPDDEANLAAASV